MPVGDRENWRRTPALFATAAVLALCVLAGFVRAALIAPLHVPLDPNEGWNAYHAAAAVITGNPYPPLRSLMTNNYPPLSFYFVGMFGALLGDDVVAGRFVSLAAFAIICVSITIALRRMKTGWSAAILAAALFAATLLLTSDYVGMNDPQLLGHAIQLIGLLCVMHRPRTGARVFMSACLFVVGVFVKHNLLALPAATAVWLCLVHGRDIHFRNAMRFVGAMILLSFAGLFAVKAVLGVNLLQTLNSPRATSFANVKENVLMWLPVAVLPLCGLVWLSFARPRDEAVSLASLYAAAAIICGALASLGAGVDVNALFDADIALALGAGLAISRLLAQGTAGFNTAAQAFALGCTLPFAVIASSVPDWREPSFWLHPLREGTAQAAQDIAFLRTHAGPAMCENLTFCYWAGKQASIDVFNLDQEFETGARATAGFIGVLRAHKFAAVELDETLPFPFPRDVQGIFLRNYRVDHQDDEGIFFVPR